VRSLSRGRRRCNALRVRAGLSTVSSPSWAAASDAHGYPSPGAPRARVLARRCGKRSNTCDASSGVMPARGRRQCPTAPGLARHCHRLPATGGVCWMALPISCRRPADPLRVAFSLITGSAASSMIGRPGAPTRACWTPRPQCWPVDGPRSRDGHVELGRSRRSSTTSPTAPARAIRPIAE